MSNEYTQEFRDEVLNWMEIASVYGVLAAVDNHDKQIRSDAVRATAEKIAEYVRGEAGGPDSVLFEVADEICATFGLSDKPKGTEDDAVSTHPDAPRIIQSNDVANTIIKVAAEKVPDLFVTVDLRYGIADALWDAGYRKTR